MYVQDFMFSEPCTVIYTCKKNQKIGYFLIQTHPYGDQNAYIDT